jgi:hypothetical protein
MTWKPVEERSKVEKDDFERRFSKKARFVVDESLGNRRRKSAAGFEVEHNVCR